MPDNERESTWEEINGKAYLVIHHYQDSMSGAIYIIYPMGSVPGAVATKYATAGDICNCKDYYYKAAHSPAYQCKHMKLAREIDSRRIDQTLYDMVKGCIGDNHGGSNATNHKIHRDPDKR